MTKKDETLKPQPIFSEEENAEDFKRMVGGLVEDGAITNETLDEVKEEFRPIAEAELKSVAERKMGRPSQGRSRRLQVNVTPELADWLATQYQDEDKSISDVVFRMLEQRKGKTMTAQQVWYREVHELENRGAVDPAPSSEVEGTLLVGEDAALTFVSHFSQFGNDHISIFPAFHNGVRCWLQKDEWAAEYGYSASGTQDSIISFEDGVKLFLEHGVFEFPVSVEMK